MNKSLLAAIAAPFIIMAAPVVAAPEDAVFCAVISGVARDAAGMRQVGLSQHETARLATDRFEKVINSPESQKRLTSESRKAAAKLWGFYATRIIQAAYSMPVEMTQARKEVAVQGTQQWAYDLCMKG